MVLERTRETDGFKIGSIRFFFIILTWFKILILVLSTVDEIVIRLQKLRWLSSHSVTLVIKQVGETVKLLLPAVIPRLILQFRE